MDWGAENLMKTKQLLIMTIYMFTCTYVCMYACVCSKKDYK